MEAFTPGACPPPPTAPDWFQRGKQFSVGVGLALFPQVLGLPLAVWGPGFFQAFGVLIVVCLPALDGIVVVTLVANYISPWVWSGALVGLLGATLLDASLLVRVLGPFLGHS